METIWIILGALLIISGIIGSLIPVLPGTPLSYLGLLCLQLTGNPPFTFTFLVVWAMIVAIIQFLEQIASVAGARKMGATRYGIIGSILGMIAGFLLFPPIGIIIGPVAGAFAGEMLGGKSYDLAFRATMGAVLGIFVSTLLKFLVALTMAYYFFTNIHI